MTNTPYDGFINTHNSDSVDNLKREIADLKQVVNEVVDILIDYIDEHHSDDHNYDNWLRDHSRELQKKLDNWESIYYENR